MSFDHRLQTLAVRQHGLLTRQQAEEHGLSRRAWYSGLQSGRLLAVAPRVAALPGAPETAERQILAAVMTAGHGAVASHRSAAHLWGVGGLDLATVDLTFTERRRALAVPWVTVHNPIDLADLRAVRRAGIPTTNPLRILVDLGQVAPEAVLPALEHFLFSGWVSRGAVARALERHGQRGRHGVRALREALRIWSIQERPPDSVLELAMHRLLGRHDLPPAVFHHRICGFEVDFALLEAKVVLECDGWGDHGRTKDQFERDRARDAALSAAGWVVLRFTWLQITRRAVWVAEIIHRTVAARSRAVS